MKPHGQYAQQKLTPDAPLWAWAYDAIGARVTEMWSHLNGVRRGEDIEAVHDMRVWSRRLVAAMRVFAVCFPDPEYQRLLREARQVTRRLGEVRDLDVLLDHYTRLTPECDPEERVAVGYLTVCWTRRRRRARKPMLTALDRLERSKYADRVREFIEREAACYQERDGNSTTDDEVEAEGWAEAVAAKAEPDPEAAFRAVAPEMLQPRIEALYAFEPYVSQPEAVEQLHSMRIAAKWLRYTLELFAPAYADGLKKPISRVKRVQELLGDLHDSDVRLELLRATLGRPLRVRPLEAMGLLDPEPVLVGLRQLLQREQRVRQGYYEAFYKEWVKLEESGFRERLERHVRRADAGK